MHPSAYFVSKLKNRPTIYRVCKLVSAIPEYDCIIIGAGPAGLSAAVYMGRFLRKTIVLDSGKGRSSFSQINDNYLGFPGGIAVRDLRKRGQEQAERFGIEFASCEVERLTRDPEEGLFTAHQGNHSYVGKTVILCPGVCDIWPPLPNVLEYVGKTLFWCLICDGFRAFNKRVVIFGHDDEAATTTCQFLNYTRRITFVSRPGTLDCSDSNVQDMLSHGVEMLEGIPVAVEGSADAIEAVILDDGRRLEADLMFSLLGFVPNNKLAVDVGVDLTHRGFVKVNSDAETNIPGLYCAGDLSNLHTHQVVAAAHEGAEAAQTANYYLYAAFQKYDEDV